MSLPYRREIDGLRAMAIIPVLLFHAGAPGFSGGFVGVDVFFVISGYLIGGKLYYAIRNDQFSFTDFYYRRARRILPAFLFVLFVSSIAAWFVLHPVALVEYAWSALTSVAFTSNVALWLQSGYFDSAAELKPLLHTWSLSIEEQFYLLAPVSLWIIYWLRSSALFKVTLVITVCSFMLSEWGARNHPSATFYLLPTRVWELLVGVLLAVREQQYPQRKVSHSLSHAAALIGLGAIVLSVALFDSSTQFPGFAALLPVGGTALVVWFARTGFLANALGFRVLVGVGLISYSLYLWHQPVLAFARYHLHDQLSANLVFCLLVLCFLLAYFTWVFLEKPFRYSKAISRGQKIIVLLVFSLGIALLSIAAILSKGAPERFDQAVLKIDAAINDKNPYSEFCHLAQGAEVEHPVANCSDYMAEGSFDVLIMGDSHSNSISYQLEEALKSHGVSSYAISYSSCIGIAGFHPPGASVSEACHRHNQKLVAFAKEVGAKSLVITSAFLGYFNDGAGEVPDGIPLDVIERLGLEPGEEQSRRLRVLNRIRDELTALAKDFDVYLVDPIPRMDRFVPEAMKRALANGENIKALGISKKQYEAEAGELITLFEQLDAKGIKRVVVAGRLCSKSRCLYSLDGNPLYYDDHHLTNSVGGKIVAEQVVEVMGY